MLRSGSLSAGWIRVYNEPLRHSQTSCPLRMRSPQRRSRAGCRVQVKSEMDKSLYSRLYYLSLDVCPVFHLNFRISEGFVFENAKSAEHIIEIANVFVPQFMAQQIYCIYFFC